MYAGVPETPPMAVAKVPPPPASMRCAMPKSMSLIWYSAPLMRCGSGATMTFSGLMSRWMKPAPCTAARPRSSPVTMAMTLAGTVSSKSFVSIMRCSAHDVVHAAGRARGAEA